MNASIENLVTVCGDQPLREKWLIAPSRRVGHQWVDRLAIDGNCALNVHIKTLRSMAIDLASAVMVNRQVTLISPQHALFLMDRVLHRLPKGRLKYLANVTGDRGLAETILSSMEAIRLASLDACKLDHTGLEIHTKGEDLEVIAKGYAKELEREHVVDYPRVLRMAIDRITKDPDCVGENALLLLPDDLRTTAIEQDLLDALPPEARYRLCSDQPADPSTEKIADSNLVRLCWLNAPSEAPAPISDASVTIVRTVGEVNEIRALLRQCLSENIRFDDVELLHTDADTYVPLIYEVLSTVEGVEADADAALPVTFAEGVPVRYSRPGRALSIWLTWAQENYPQERLVKAIREGLLEIPGSEKERSGLNRLAAQFRGIGIGIGRDRYLNKIDESIDGLNEQIAAIPEADEEGEESTSRRKTRLQIELRDARVLRKVVSRLLELTPASDAGAGDIVAGAKQFVEAVARRANKFDQFAAKRLLEEIQGLEGWLAEDGDDVALDVWHWFADLPGQLRVLGSGPRAGALHVDHVRSGGHSGRPHTFIVGLDDSRFPGAGIQDPLLLDSERRNLSSALPTAASRLEQTIEDFARLLARLRGQLTLSYCCHNVVDDREMFPSPLLLAAFRVLSGRPEADQSDLLAAVDAPVSFAPATPDGCLTLNEWWLWRLCGPETVEGAGDLIQQRFPHLAQGSLACVQRQSDEFTVYDGCVPAAASRLDPTADEGRVVSASALQTLGKCPLQFFYQYGLGIKLPDEVIVDASRWLDPLAFGSMMHELFEQFMRELLQEKRRPEFNRDHARLEELIAQKVAEYRDLYPPPTQSAFQSQLRELQVAAATFLREEERYCSDTKSRPVYLEASLGLPPDGHGTPLDTIDPVPVTLPNGQQIRTRGRIDRVDQVGDGAMETYAVWDYKSGSTYGYDRADPFRQGRLMQPLLYVSIVGHCLRESVSPKAGVTNFGFFFPGSRAAGQRVSWSSAELATGMSILEQLCDVIRRGAFLPTNDHETDCTYCDYISICGNVTAVATASQTKMDNHKNRLLKPIRELRANG